MKKPFITPARYHPGVILDIIPGLRQARRMGGGVDVATATRAIDAHLDSALAEVQAMGAWLETEENPDLQWVAERFDNLLTVFNTTHSAIFTLPMLASPTDAEAIAAHARTQMVDMEMVLAQSLLFAGEQIMRHLDRRLTHFPNEAPQWQWLRGMAAHMVEVSERGSMAQPDTEARNQAESHINGLLRSHKPLQDMAPEQPRIAASLSAIIHYNNAYVQRYGFDDYVEYFLNENHLTPDQVDGMRSALKAESPAGMRGRLRNARPFIGKDEHYSWQKAANMVVQAFNELHPEMGTIAQRAFDEEWIWVHNQPTLGRGTANAGKPSHLGGHPWIRVEFDGTPRSVLTLAHEMGHAVAFYLAGQEYDAYRFGASISLHETFALLAECKAADVIARSRPKNQSAYREWLQLDTVIHKMGVFSEADMEMRLVKSLAEGKVANLSFPQIVSAAKLAGESSFWDEMDAVYFTSFLSHAPMMANLSYPLAGFAGARLWPVMQSDPNFGQRLKEVMEAGSEVSLRRALAHMNPLDPLDALTPEWFRDISRGVRQQLTVLERSQLSVFNPGGPDDAPDQGGGSSSPYSGWTGLSGGGHHMPPDRATHAGRVVQQPRGGWSRNT